MVSVPDGYIWQLEIGDQGTGTQSTNTNALISLLSQRSEGVCSLRGRKGRRIAKGGASSSTTSAFQREEGQGETTTSSHPEKGPLMGYIKIWDGILSHTRLGEAGRGWAQEGISTFDSQNKTQTESKARR